MCGSCVGLPGEGIAEPYPFHEHRNAGAHANGGADGQAARLNAEESCVSWYLEYLASSEVGGSRANPVIMPGTIRVTVRGWRSRRRDIPTGHISPCEVLRPLPQTHAKFLPRAESI
jgi:hypothetical protein